MSYTVLVCSHFDLRGFHPRPLAWRPTPIANILSDIVTYFFEDFVISGPVWEYFSGENES